MCISMLLSGTSVYSMELTETGHEDEDLFVLMEALRLSENPLLQVLADNTLAFFLSEENRSELVVVVHVYVSAMYWEKEKKKKA